MENREAASLAERVKILERIYRCAFCIDTKDWQAYGENFTDPVELDFSGLGFGGEGLQVLSREQWVKAVSGGMSRYASTQHLVSNYSIEFNQEGAVAVSYVQARHFMASAGGRRRVLDQGGYYTYNLVKADGIWRVKRSRLSLLWTQGDPEAMPPQGNFLKQD